MLINKTLQQTICCVLNTRSITNCWVFFKSLYLYTIFLIRWLLRHSQIKKRVILNSLISFSIFYRAFFIAYRLLLPPKQKSLTSKDFRCNNAYNMIYNYTKRVGKMQSKQIMFLISVFYIKEISKIKNCNYLKKPFKEFFYFSLIRFFIFKLKSN